MLNLGGNILKLIRQIWLMRPIRVTISLTLEAYNTLLYHSHVSLFSFSCLFGLLCDLLGQRSLDDVLAFLSVEHLKLFNHLDDKEAVLDHFVVLLLSELTTLQCWFVLVFERLHALFSHSTYATPVVLLFL